VLYPTVTVPQLVRDFEAYCDPIRRKTTLLARPSGEQVTVPATSGSRYFPDGQRRIVKRLRARLGSSWSQAGVLVTLTYDPKLISCVDAWRSVGKHRRQFCNRLWLYRKRHDMGNKPLGYLSVLEVQPSTGYPHVHMVLPGIRWLAPCEAVTMLWCHGYTDVRLCDSVGPTNYICKYLSKMSGWSQEHLAYLHTFAIRMYSVGLRYSLPRPFVLSRGRKVYLPVSPWFFVAQYTSASSESPPLDNLPLSV
jgi:hypothetical protein